MKDPTASTRTPKETMRRVLVILALTLTTVGVGALAPATSSAKVAVGVADQKPQVFQNPLFKSLHTKRTRYFVAWNVMSKKADKARFTTWYNAARGAHQEMLVSFTAATGNRCPRSRCKLPSMKSYKSAFKKFHKRYKKVKIFSPWNEANHRTQPTFKHPKRAAQYYNYVRKACKHCKIVAADVIDETNMVRWVKTFKRYATKPRIWGLHNYRDTNPRKKSFKGGTRKLLRITRGQVWMTETGGLFYFRIGKTYLFKPSKGNSTSNKGIKRMFSLAKRYRKRIKRVYIYEFQAPINMKNQFDAGLVDKTGTVKRPAYNTVRKRSKKYFTR